MIEEMLTAQATIQAAEIQKWGNIWAALLGGGALGLGVLASWYTSLRLQRDDRLIETKRDVYLELVESYSDMVTGFHLLLTDLDQNWKSQQKLILVFNKSADKVVFICDTETKQEIFKLLEIFQSKYLEIYNVVNPLIEKIDEINALCKRHSKVMELFNNAATEFEKIKLNREGMDRVPHIQDYFDEKLKEGESYLKSMDQIEKELIDQSKTLGPLLKEFINELNKLSGPIVCMLREELGAKTDVKLDEMLRAQLIIK